MPKLENAEIVRKGLRVGTRTLKSGKVYYAAISLRGARRITVSPIIGRDGNAIVYANGAIENRNIAKQRLTTFAVEAL